MKNKKTYRIILSIVTWLLSALSASFGYSFLSSLAWPFFARFLAGFFLMATPTLVLLLIIELFRKEQ